MKVLIDNMLVNRSAFTRRFKTAGVPVTQMYTHVPSACCMYHNNEQAVKLFDGSNYMAMVKASTQGGQHHNAKTMSELLTDIESNGVKNPLFGYALGDGKIELFCGHHRASIAYVVGFRELECNVIPLDANKAIAPERFDKVRAAYDKVHKAESLSRGRSYNPFPAMQSYRPTADRRLQRIYAALIDMSGEVLYDLGCNDGYFGVALAMHDFKVTLVDRSRAYLDVVNAKLEALSLDSVTRQWTVNEFLSTIATRSDATIYTDVFYHTVLEQGCKAAMHDLERILDLTRERLIFAPGRWDKLADASVTQAGVFAVVRKRAKRITYLGKDNDPGYQRELYRIDL